MPSNYLGTPPKITRPSVNKVGRLRKLKKAIGQESTGQRPKMSATATALTQRRLRG